MHVLMMFRQVRNQGNLVLCKAERLFILQEGALLTRGKLEGMGNFGERSWRDEVSLFVGNTVCFALMSRSFVFATFYFCL